MGGMTETAPGESSRELAFLAAASGGRVSPDNDADEAPVNPWERFSWILGIIWVIFMLFPLTAALRSPAPTWARIAGFIILLAYTGVYIASYIWMIRSREWELAWRRGLIGIATMAVLMIAAALLVGPEALGAGAFLISLAAFAGPVKRAMILMGSLFLAQYAALTIVLAAMSGFAEHGILYMPPAIVLVSVSAVRLLVAAGDRHEQIERQRDIVAERERVARDVHDVLGHSLTVVTVKAELAERLIDIDPERAKAEIAEIRSLSREALAEVRATVAGLRVARLGDEIVSARDALAAAGIEAAIDGSVGDVDPRHRIVAAWALREAITNVVRHSRATRCDVTLAHEAITVADNGVGILPEQVERGFRGLRERVAAAGGTLTVTATGHGTRLEVRW